MTSINTSSPRRKSPHPIERRVTINLLRDGCITQAEAADMAGVSRQAIHKWCLEAHINAVGARSDYVIDAWEEEAEALEDEDARSRSSSPHSAS